MIEWLQQLPQQHHHHRLLDAAAAWLGLHRKHGGGGEEPLPPWLFWTYLGVSGGLVAMAGLMSGLTLGLMSLDELDLEVLKRSGTPSERRHARRIMPLIANEHFLLVTLLLFNALSTEALPIFLDKLVDPISAVLLSVTVVLVIGEILPQAVCRSYGLQVGSYAAWLVRALMFISSPVSWPIGKLLDSLLGDEQTALFRRAQLKALVGLHSSAEGLGGNLTADEIAIITGALDLTAKTAWTALTPIDKVFMLPSDRLLDESALQDILMSGHSRLPVHEPGDRRKLLGLILVKELVLVDPEQGLTAGHLVSRTLPCLPADTPLYQLLRLFESGGSHMVALTMPPPRSSSRASGEHPLSPAGPSADYTAAAAATSATPLLQQQPAGAAAAGVAGLAAVAPLPRIRSGVIKAGEGLVYIEAASRGPLSPQSSWGGGSVGGGQGPGSPPGTSAAAAGQPGGYSGPLPPGLCEGCSLPADVAVGDPVGIITIEDVIEELLQSEIIDETDQFVDNLQVTRVDAYALTTSLPPRLRKAYAQQFTPRVGRLVVHYPHHHAHRRGDGLGGGGGVSGGSGSWKGSSVVLKQQQFAPRAAYSNPATPLAGNTPLGGSPASAMASPISAAAAAVGSPAAAASSLSGNGQVASPTQHHHQHLSPLPEQRQLRLGLDEDAAGPAAVGGDVHDAAAAAAAEGQQAAGMLHNLGYGLRHHAGHIQPHLHPHHHQQQQPQQQQQQHGGVSGRSWDSGGSSGASGSLAAAAAAPGRAGASRFASSGAVAAPSSRPRGQQQQQQQPQRVVKGFGAPQQQQYDGSGSGGGGVQ